MKLFKKVAAAVLAGVMALSMVACAPTTDPSKDTPAQDTPASSAAVTDVLKWMNNKRASDSYSEKKLIENDATLAKQAELFLNTAASDIAIATADRANRVGTVAGVKVTYTNPADSAQNFAKALFTAGIAQMENANKVYVFSGNSMGAATTNLATTSVVVDLSKPYKLDDALKQSLENFGAGLTIKGESGDHKVGVASKTIGDNTYVVVVVNK